MTKLTCVSCDHFQYGYREGNNPQLVGCKLHGQIQVRLLKECPDAQYAPGSDEAEFDEGEE